MGKTGPSIRPNDFDKLQEILKDMDIPQSKRGDLRWISKNIHIKNKEHPRFSEAANLIRSLLFIK